MFDLIYSFYWTNSCFTDGSLVETNSTHDDFPLTTVSLLSHPSLWILELMPWRFQTPARTHRLVVLLPGTAAGAIGHKMAPGCMPLLHLSLYLQPKHSSTSDCRKLHGHFNTVFLLLLLIKHRKKKSNMSNTSNLYGGERPLLYKKKTSWKYANCDAELGMSVLSGTLSR